MMGTEYYQEFTNDKKAINEIITDKCKESYRINLLPDKLMSTT